MFKSRFQKRNSVQRFKPLLKNMALGYIEKKNKKKITRWVYSRVLSRAIHKRILNHIKCGFSTSGAAFY